MSPYAGYRSHRQRHSQRKHKLLIVTSLILLVAGAGLTYKLFATAPNPVEQAAKQLQFDATVSEVEKQAITAAIQQQSKTYDGDVTASVKTSLQTDDAAAVTTVYVPVTNAYTSRQLVTKDELAELDVHVAQNTDNIVRTAIATALNVHTDKLTPLDGAAETVSDTAVVFIPIDELSPKVKLLGFEGGYYLDNFDKGAVFRQVTFSGSGASGLKGISLNNNPDKNSTLKVNMTGVTALTREMMDKLQTVGGNADYFSEHIGAFLADADITHVSNEVSFKDGCTYSHAVFCSPPEMIETLKSSGVDLVELTGNHNNDVGSQYNTDTINLYHSLGWQTVGGGLNLTEAAKPYIADKKGTKVAFLAYNYADAPGGGAIATASSAGANPYNAEQAQADIASAKQQADVVIVDMQFWECYSYPDGYIEFPECDVPIGQQSSVFRQLADYGADMVIGTQAHQPQTYEVYNGTPIYYGLGNMYFEQTNWPGTERGIVLTHYFTQGKRLQTKMTPTVYDSTYQPRVMDNSDALYLLDRLNTARQTAGL